jgi:hypothetical protein
MRKLIHLVLLLITVLLAGCVTVSMDAAKKDQIQQVSVNEHVEFSPDSIAFNGRGQAWGAGIGGIIGAAIASGSIDSAKQQIQLFLDNQQIDVGAIVRNAFVHGLAADPTWGPRLQAESTTHFDLQIVFCGLTMTQNIFGSNFKPWLSVRATLVDQDGKTLWQAHDYVAQYNSATPEATYDQFLSDPKYFRDALSVAASELARSLIGKLN